ncbi:MAG: hypothetical protein ACREX9_11090 [Gammaproteobacteria bacterium]
MIGREQGHTCRKTGRGFYRYKLGNARKGSAGEIDHDLQDRLMLPLLRSCGRDDLVKRSRNSRSASVTLLPRSRLGILWGSLAES